MANLSIDRLLAAGGASQAADHEEVAAATAQESGLASTTTTCALSALTSTASTMLGGLFSSIRTISSFPVSSFFIVKTTPTMVFPAQQVYPASIPPSILAEYQKKEAIAFKENAAWSDPELHTVAAPTDEGLLLLSAYYSKKYDVPIFIAGNDLKLRSAVLGEFVDAGTPYWGVIATSGCVEALHVTPILCMKLPDGQIQIAEMDSVRQPIDSVKRLFVDLHREGIYVDIFSSYFARQADYFSCRTDAIVLLKDALRDLKLKKVTNLKTFLNVHLKNGILPKFFLPARWSKTIQISGSYIDCPAEKALSKRDLPMHVFRELYNEKVNRVDTYRFQFYLPNGSFESSQHLVTVEKTVNMFLNIKGKLFMRQFADLQSSEDFELQMRFGFLLDMYK